MIHLESLTKEFGGYRLFDGVSWHIRRADRIALVGDNGAGKSTLMRLLAGIEEPSSGTLTIAKGCRIAYLPQDGIVTKGTSLFHEVRSALQGLLALEQELHYLGEALGSLDHQSEDYAKQLERYGAVQDRFRDLGGYRIESELAVVLNGLGFSQGDWHRDCGEFSGGWQMRIALARLLLAKPDLLLLDEPTNHLDLDARNWLEQYLQEYQGSVVLVSHDRLFMDRVCGRTAEVWNQGVTEYAACYSEYLVQRTERMQALREAKRIQDEEIARCEEFIQRFRSQATKASLVQSRIRQLEKIERIQIPPERKRIAFSFPTAPPSGRVVFDLMGVSKAYDTQPVFKNVSLTIEKGERVALVGYNGAGKSTLMQLLAGGFSPTTGDLLLGHQVTREYFAQNQAEALKPNRTVYEELYDGCPYAMVPRLRDILGAFLFSGDAIDKSVSVLSGGERNRLALAKMLLRPANVLLLDEPTNHLDLQSKDILLDALRQFAGTVVFVSHDRYFVTSLASRIVEVADGTVTSYHGDYEYYLEKRAEGMAAPAALSGVSQPTKGGQRDDRVRDREEQRKRKREDQARDRQRVELEQRIEQFEHELASLESAMNTPGFFDDVAQGADAGERHALLQVQLEETYAAWEALL